MKFNKILSIIVLVGSLFSANSYAELPKPLATELNQEVQRYETLYQQKRGQEIFDYVDKKVLTTLAERAKRPDLVKITETMLTSMIENAQNLSIKMDLAQAQSDVSSAGIAFAIIPYVMTINGTPMEGKMLAIKDNGKWTFSRFDESNNAMVRTIEDVYPSLKLK